MLFDWTCRLIDLTWVIFHFQASFSPQDRRPIGPARGNHNNEVMFDVHIASGKIYGLQLPSPSNDDCHTWAVPNDNGSMIMWLPENLADRIQAIFERYRILILIVISWPVFFTLAVLAAGMTMYNILEASFKTNRGPLSPNKLRGVVSLSQVTKWQNQFALVDACMPGFRSKTVTPTMANRVVNMV
jgi:hypothetical protein